MKLKYKTHEEALKAQKEAQHRWYEKNKEEQKEKNRQRYYANKEKWASTKKINKKKEIIGDEKLQQLMGDIFSRWNQSQKNNQNENIDSDFKFIYLILEAYFKNR